MTNILLESIQEHLCMLDLALTSSEKIVAYAAKEKLDSVVSETENRERLVNVISKIQATVEDQINQLNVASMDNADIMILKSWFQDLSIWSEKMIACDKQTVELLAQQKEETTKEIASLFKSKELFKGYNHSIRK
jgi:hypothetical protein